MQSRIKGGLFQGVDFLAVLYYLLLVAAGCICITAASFDEETADFFAFSHFYIKQYMWVTAVLVVALVVLLLDVRYYHLWAYPLYIIGIVVMIGVLIAGKEVNGAKSWIELGSLRIQPVEFVKIATALALARVMSNYSFSINRFGDLLRVGVIVGIPMLLTILQNDTGSGIVLGAFLFVLYREGLNKWLCIPILLIAALFIVSFLLTPMTLLVLLILNFVVVPWASERQIKEVDYGTFMSMTEEKNIGRVDIESNQILFTDKENTQVYKTGLMSDPNLTERLYDAGAQFSSEIVEQASPLLSFLASFVLPIVIFVALGNYMNKKLMEKAGGGAGSMMFGGVGKSNAKVYVQSTHGIRFADVAGEDEAKENLQEIVDYLHDPSKYKEIGASMPKGILLVGPPGTGKTMLAKAVAGESNVPFFSMSGSEFVEMFVGMGASKVRDLFKQAKEKAPCIVFIDEIDAIGQKRNSGQYGGNDEREQTLNQLLTEMDGFENNNGVIILAATNRPESLDPALTRPGRFDRRVPVELPDLKGREEILKVHAKKIALAPGVDFNTVARMASGASGAELANIVNEAALRAVRAGRKSVTEADLEESIEVVIAGYQKKNSILTDHEKCIVAYHEIGHALVAALQNHSAPVQKITIIPRTSGALGYTMQVDEGNHYLMSKEELENKIATLTGGRAAEEVVFGSVTTGASNDIEQATKLARAMITRYGMSKDFDMVALETVTNQYLGGDSSLACSAQTQREIDQKVVELVKAEHAKAIRILTDNRAKLDELAKYLYEKETITGEEFMNILNREDESAAPAEEKIKE